MPKLKSKSGAKKRFSLTGTGKVKRNHAKHRHILAKKSSKVKRNQRGTAILQKGDAAIVKRSYLPYA
ncbi:MAG: 50S ribosomal protein L35 [Alphaproteobacteria bacterium]|nr:50S ribosomal protein L35 [Alphaproteobacteria bacterium]